MTLLTLCIPCQHGDHEGHQEVVQHCPPGMCGGARCICAGECVDKERPKWPWTSSESALLDD